MFGRWDGRRWMMRVGADVGRADDGGDNGGEETRAMIHALEQLGIMAEQSKAEQNNL